MAKYILKLYVSGESPKSRQAIENLSRAFEREGLENQYEIEIIDILNNPELAESEKILATPTLIKEYPLPVRRIIGDLSDAERVLIDIKIVSRTKKS